MSGINIKFLATLSLIIGFGLNINAQQRKIVGNTLIYVQDNDTTDKDTTASADEEFDIEKYFNPNISDEERALHKKNIQQFSDQIKENPQDVSAYVNRGSYYSYLGLYPQAIKDYNKAIEIYPRIPEVYYNRGLAKARFVYTLDACTDFKKAELLGLMQAKAVIMKSCKRYADTLKTVTLD